MTDHASTPAPGGVFRLIYRSESRIPEEGSCEELGRLFGVARSRNKRAGITGALLCSDGVFVQVLEGEEQPVRSLYAHIAEDPRHVAVTLVDCATVPERVFGRWSMARVAEDGDPDIPLIAHRDGISPAAGRPTTEAQEQVLSVMRREARGQSHAR